MKANKLIWIIAIIALALIPITSAAVYIVSPVASATSANPGEVEYLGYNITITDADLTTGTITIQINSSNAGTTATKWYLYDATNKTRIASGSFSSQTGSAVLTTPLVLNRQYYAVLASDGAAFTIYSRNSGTYPVTGTGITANGRAVGSTNALTWNTYTGAVFYDISSITLSKTSASPTITFQGQTPANNSNVYYEDNFYLNTTTQDLGGTITTTHYLYNSTGHLIASNSSTSNPYISGYTLPTSGTYYFNASATNGTASAITERRQINVTYWNAYLGITLKNAFNASLSINATVNVTDLTHSWTQQYTTTNGTILALIAKGHTQNLFIDAPGYAYASQNYTSNQTLYQYVNVSLYTNNSVYINILDESTGYAITENISVVITGTAETTYSSVTGYLYVDNLQDGTYTVKLSGANYSLAQYSVTVTARSTQTLNAYLSLNSQTVIFTILDFDSAAIIPAATFTQSRLINGTWTVIQSKTSDITGRVQVNYLPSVNYQFIVSATGYTTQIFYLNPVIFSTYNVRLERITSLTPQNTPDYQGLSVNFNPTSFYNNRSHTFYWVISSPTGELSAYNLSLTYPGGTSTSTGINAYGESFTHIFNITSANVSSQVTLRYCYDTTTSPNKCFTYKYGVIGAYGNQSFIGAQGMDYQFGALDGVLIATVITLTVSGIAFSIGGIMAGLPIAMLLLGVFYYIGLISLWGVLPSLLIGFFILFGRTEGG